MDFVHQFFCKSGVEAIPEVIKNSRREFREVSVFEIFSQRFFIPIESEFRPLNGMKVRSGFNFF